jgi:RNA polymerase sigma-70 factor (ECF subfamily)
MTNTWTDDQVIEAIRAGGVPRRLAEEYLYKTLRRMAVGTVVNMQGTEEEIDEAFPDAFLKVVKRLENPGFSLTSAKLSTYFMDVLIKDWRTNKGKTAKRQARIVEVDPQSYKFGEPSTLDEEDLFLEERYHKVSVGLEKLGERCKKLLTLFAEGFKMTEIAAEMGFKSEAVAKNEVSGCRNKLRYHLNGKA